MISVTKTTMYATGWILWLKARLGILSDANYGRVLMYYQEYNYSFSKTIFRTLFKYQKMNDYIAWAMIECAQGEVTQMYLKWAKENNAEIPATLFHHLIKEVNLHLLKDFVTEIPLTVRQERILIRKAYLYGDTYSELLKYYLASGSKEHILKSEVNVKLMKQLGPEYQSPM